jgi:hypothetical protein
LRGVDIVNSDGIHAMKISPEADQAVAVAIPIGLGRFDRSLDLHRW